MSKDYFPGFIRERNLEIKDGKNTMALVYPGKYSVGMGGMTILALKAIVETVPNWSMERYYLPYNPVAEPRGVERGIPLRSATVIGFTSQFEVDYLAISWILQKAGIPLDNRKRRGKYPPIIVGGPGVGANRLFGAGSSVQNCAF